MFAKESNNARVEVPVKSRSVEAGRIGTWARQVRRELWRARRQKSVVTGWDDGNVDQKFAAIDFGAHVSLS
jgi:hypothetical protein